MAISRTGQTPGCDHGPGCPHDIGPAGAGVDGLSAMGRLSALRVPDVGGSSIAQGYGPIERRLATPEDLARLDPPEPHREPVPIRLAEDATVTISIDTPAPPFALPCGLCIHSAVCGLRDQIPTAPAAPLAMEIAPGLRVVSTAFAVECDHYLPPVALRETVRDGRPPTAAAATRLASQHRGGRANADRIAAKRHPSSAGEAADKAKRAADCLAALERHGGDRRAAAAELGIKGNAFAMIVKYAQPQSVSA